jgi:hypothetical protein
LVLALVNKLLLLLISIILRIATKSERVGTIDGFIFVLLDHRDIRRSSDCSFQRDKS